ncbi:uncharacterized protein DEA37_0009987 [Paragonimus westermani]|uniref:Uncharacterized protein n=1 Tax=Paragonimus westermani TaxID=34504 RepID=A0A5J4N966_9TREM|nr:uncharacterized protein DEA37_0009987 [Paragonimus westermani]
MLLSLELTISLQWWGVWFLLLNELSCLFRFFPVLVLCDTTRLSQRTHCAPRLRATNRHVYRRSFKSVAVDGSHTPQNVLINRVICSSLPKLAIIPTAIWFGEHYSRTYETVDFAFIPSHDLRDQTVRLFYGTHSSEHEITELVLSIKPKKAVACCTPPSDTLESVQSRLDALVAKSLDRPNKSPSIISSCQTGDSSELFDSIRMYPMLSLQISFYRFPTIYSLNCMS